MQRHWGVQCPDGMVMCEMCFDRFAVGDLHVTDDGTPENVCKTCAALEQQAIERRDRR